ncbi:MAG: TRAP transporter large permease subunit, partial [Rhodobacteraceae bacterium]|nr:TRAP transporter large permease subunit [Paracoccaceae bacterium]
MSDNNVPDRVAGTVALVEADAAAIEAETIADGVDDEVIASNQRVFGGHLGLVMAALCVLYTSFHIFVMNVYPLEPWVYRLIHVGGGLALGFVLYAARALPEAGADSRLSLAERALILVAAVLLVVAGGQLAAMWVTGDLIATGAPATKYLYTFGYPLMGGTVAALAASWIEPQRNRSILSWADTLLSFAAVIVALYIILHADFLRIRAQVFPHPNDMWASIAGIVLILELTRRLAGLALVIIVGVFIAYGFLGPWLPGVLHHNGYAPARFFAFIYTDNGILGPTTSISSTYIILFIAFAAFLQASRVGEYFVNFAFAVAGSARGGPAKVAVFASGLMGMINGTSAGNVVATGSLTIPLMKKVGYKPQTAASVEAAASTGG